jgi:hypothetical protein
MKDPAFSPNPPAGKNERSERRATDAHDKILHSEGYALPKPVPGSFGCPTRE